MRHRPLFLIVLDGWGHRVEREHNAILRNAHYFQELCERFPHTLLSASGNEVGLPLGLMGNSEVGHMNLGAGRVVYQDITRIDKDIREGRFFETGAIVNALERARRAGSRLHLLGLISDGERQAPAPTAAQAEQIRLAGLSAVNHQVATK